MYSDPVLLEPHGAQLYGAGRNFKNAELKNVLQSSHILQNGEYNLTAENLKSGIWRSSATRDFAGTFSKDVESRDNPNQLSHHFRLGNDSSQSIPRYVYQESATKAEFVRKHGGKQPAMEEHRVVNWPDMAPNLRQNPQTGSTEYNISFAEQNDQRVGPSHPKVNASHMQFPLDPSSNWLQKATTFSLGTDQNGLLSEHSRAYKRQSSAGPPSSFKNTQSKMGGEVMKQAVRASSIFRGGDYNDHVGNFSTWNTDIYGPRTIPIEMVLINKDIGNRNLENSSGSQSRAANSSNEDQASINQLVAYARQNTVPEVFADALNEKSYQTNAHFVFGEDDGRKNSQYARDFSYAEDMAYKPPTFYVTPSAKHVLQRDVQRLGISRTSSQDDASAQAVFRMAPLRAPRYNVARMLDSSGGSGNVLPETRKRTVLDKANNSLFQDSYLSQPEGYQAPERSKMPTVVWDYLRTDDVLPYSSSKGQPSEAKNHFIGTFMNKEYSTARRRQKDIMCKSRLEDGRETHFDVGYANRDFISETNVQFNGEMLNDKHVPAAGIYEVIPEERVSHLKVCENLSQLHANDVHKPNLNEPITRRQFYKQCYLAPLTGDSIYQTSIMNNDYTNSRDRSFTDMQQVVINQNSILEQKPFARSHLFHGDVEMDNIFLSTTGKDFIKPSLVAG